MHILLIHQVFAALDEAGGTRHHEFARYLAAQGHQVTVITSSVSYLTGARLRHPELEMAGGQGGRVCILHAYNYRDLHKSFIHRFLFFVTFMASSFWIGLGVKNVDVVWGTSPPIFQGVTAWVLARLKKVPFLFEVRDLWPKFAIGVGVLKSPLLIRMSEWLEKSLYVHADQVIVNSPGYVDHVKERGARRVDLVPNGADPEMFNPLDTGRAFRDQYRLNDSFVVLYAGAHGMSNDLGVVLEAAVLLEKQQPDVQIVFLGDGKEKPALEMRARDLNLKNVVFLPPVPKKAMSDVLAGADACLAILKPIEEYKTTYPNKVFDYMAAGRPVVLAIDGVIRDVLEAAGCGYFVPPGDAGALAQAIAKLATDRERSRNMGLDGRKYLENHFSREGIAQKLLDVLDGTIQAGPQRQRKE